MAFPDCVEHLGSCQLPSRMHIMLAMDDVTVIYVIMPVWRRQCPSIHYKSSFFKKGLLYLGWKWLLPGLSKICVGFSLLSGTPLYPSTLGLASRCEFTENEGVVENLTFQLSREQGTPSPSSTSCYQQTYILLIVVPFAGQKPICVCVSWKRNGGVWASPNSSFSPYFYFSCQCYPSTLFPRVAMTDPCRFPTLKQIFPPKIFLILLSAWAAFTIACISSLFYKELSHPDTDVSLDLWCGTGTKGDIGAVLIQHEVALEAKLSFKTEQRFLFTRQKGKYIWGSKE